jgi:hypothetical protein
LGRSLKEGEIQYSDGNYKGEYFSIKYPTNAKPFDKSKLANINPDIIEYFSFDGYDPRVTFTASVAQPKGSNYSNLDEVSGVNLRENNKDLYEFSNIEINGTVGRLYKKTQESFEETAFLIRDGKLFTFSLTAGSSGDFEAQFQELINSVTFFN